MTTFQQRRRRAREQIYSSRRRDFLQENPYCQVCGLLATEVHHALGRVPSSRLIEVATFRAVCHACHARAHADRAWGEANGLVGSRLAVRDDSA